MSALRKSFVWAEFQFDFAVSWGNSPDLLAV